MYGIHIRIKDFAYFRRIEPFFYEFTNEVYFVDFYEVKTESD